MTPQNATMSENLKEMGQKSSYQRRRQNRVENRANAHPAAELRRQRTQKSSTALRALLLHQGSLYMPPRCERAQQNKHSPVAGPPRGAANMQQRISQTVAKSATQKLSSRALTSKALGIGGCAVDLVQQEQNKRRSSDEPAHDA
eukprot:TRINITY_DN85_c0_g1_i3.p2 TRINITY_DN85_c0_g1~~TRINITY_DN85_c0_g1_i3.p2  ORF type:complete len:144 (+),score=11.75 TRINITY_DN85_c0_g1_i3:132-563(+)